jgi:tetratricopeptide (TPR) repeat protein
MVGAYLIFSNTFLNSWTYDDFPVIVNNPDIRSIRLFIRNFYDTRVVRDLSLLVDYFFFGLNPVGYHIQNIFWHGLNACLIFILIGRLGGSTMVAWTASLLFLVHPIQVEVVANISNRKDSLCLAFSLLSLITYIQAFRGSSKRWVWLVTALCLAYIAMKAKENAYALPFIFLAYEKVFLAPEERLLLRKSWIWISSLAIGIVVFFMWYFFFEGRNEFLIESQEKLARVNFFSQSSEAVYYSMTLKSWAFMFIKFLFPYKLSADYIYPLPRNWSDLWVFSSLIGIVLYGLLMVFSIRRFPIAFFALFWFGTFWLPTSNLWPSLTRYFAADRYQYVPSVGFFIFSGILLSWIIKDEKARVYVVLCLILPLSILTWHQNTVWQSSLSLWTHAEKVSPGSVPALNGLGRIYMREREFDQAISCFLRSIKSNPYFANSYINLAIAYEGKGEKHKALEYYRKYIEMNPQNYQIKTMTIREHLKKRYGVTF